VNDFFLYSPTDIEKDADKKEAVAPAPAKAEKKDKRDDIGVTTVTYKGNDYNIRGNIVEDSNGNQVAESLRKEIMDSLTAKPEELPEPKKKVNHSFMTKSVGENTGRGLSLDRIERAERARKRKHLLTSDTQETAAPKESLYQNEEKIRRLLPQLSEQGRIVVVQGLIKTVDEAGNPVEAYGEFRDGILTISSEAPLGTVYHEAFHYVTDMLLSDNDRAILFAVAKDKYGDLSELGLEEKMAEDFRHFMNGRDDKSILGKLRTFFNNLKHIVKGLTGNLSKLDILFYDIYKGRFASRQDRYGTLEEMKILRDAPLDSNGRLLAPNGKPSKLTARQYAQVRTKAFKEWFGDWENDPKNASKVVDENGEPLVVYHHTRKGVGRFGSFHDGIYEEEVTKQDRPIPIFNPEITGAGVIFFTSSNSAQNIYYPNIQDDKDFTSIPVFLNVRNLTEADGIGSGNLVTRGEATSIKEEGFDGFYQNFKSGDTFYGVFEANQIKSAKENSGRFSSRDKNIYDEKEAFIRFKEQKTRFSSQTSETQEYLKMRGITEKNYDALPIEDREIILRCVI
jgi:hypothetical protein